MIDLCHLARESIKAAFDNKKLSPPKSELSGVFVTLYEGEELRGCIGFPEPVEPLYVAVVDAARAAAFEDPRFPPLKKSELSKIRIEVSVLTKPELIEVSSSSEYLKKIKVGEDGLIVRCGFDSGLLLPQVAVEYAWTVEEFLENTCMKAGLPADCWKSLKCRIFKFQAKIYKE